MIFKKLTIDLCRCEIVSETNALDYCCDEVADQFELVKPSRRLEYICTPALYPPLPSIHCRDMAAKEHACLQNSIR